MLDPRAMKSTHKGRRGRGPERACAPPLPKKIGEKYFSGYYYIKFRHFSGKKHMKFRNFVNFSGKYHENSDILLIFGQK